MTLDEAKKAARAEAMERRARAHEALARDRGAAQAGQALCETFMASVPIPTDAIVSGYWPVKEEIDDLPLLRRLIALVSPVLGMLLLLAVPGRALAQENSDCLMCHGDKDLTKQRNGKTVSLFVDATSFASAVHGKV